MDCYRFQNLRITLNKQGAREFQKVSYPIRYGHFAEAETPDYVFQFNLNGEIKTIRGKGPHWPHPAEWLKRTTVNDWVYYAVGDYSSTYDLFGEYYFPHLPYPSNNIMGDDPFRKRAIQHAVMSAEGLLKQFRELVSTPIPQRLKNFLTRTITNDERTLHLRARKLHGLLEARLPVLPPDTRHVDYEVVPVIVADGCRSNCGFCRVKSKRPFDPRNGKEVARQIRELRAFYADDIHNYNAVFLGQHDALAAGRDLLERAAKTAYDLFELEHSHLRAPRLFLFGSAGSLIDSDESLFATLNDLPFSTCINVGLESADPETLTLLGKPLTPATVNKAFTRMVNLNRDYEQIEVTANFVFGNGLPQSHLDSIIDLTCGSPDRFHDRGTIYLSPLFDQETRSREEKRQLIKQFSRMKMLSRLPTFLYLIQRL